ncbi:MAG: hypothetical protein AAFV80_23790 [Bacteroidota bacterium]
MFTIKPNFLFILLAFAFLGNAHPKTAFNEGRYFQIKNKLLGSEMALEVIQIGTSPRLRMNQSNPSDAQYWSKLGDGSQTQLFNKKTGKDQRLSISSVGKNELISLSGSRGEIWVFEKVDNQYFRIWPKSRGKNKSIDVITNDGIHRLQLQATKDISSQLWQLSPVTP